MSKMKLSIIMVSLIADEKRVVLAERAVNHLIKYSNNFEFIYVDNGSSFRLDCEKDVDIYIRNKENIGITKAFNQGFKLSSGEVIAFVDNDIDIKSDWQEKTLDILNQKYDALSLYECNDYNKYLSDASLKKYTSCPLYRDCFWLIKRDVFNKIGLLDENIFCYSEGLDFFIRMCQAGLSSAVISEVQHWHRHQCMPYIDDSTKNKDILYLKEKWGINSNKEGINLAIQLFNKHKK